ncbi:MAG: glucose-1-phosphate thymidylyltransferase [Nanoarchaeota archaeon]|nr:glucose-1-phosphate thymidylyltransferase [Nanoarchaeota archaeon]
MKGLILAGGHGVRLRPITNTLQKQLIPIANKPIIHYVIEDLVNAGIKDVGIVVGPNKEQIIEAVGDGTKLGCKITYIYQDEPKGLAHAILVSKDYLKDEDFIMYLGDNLIKGGIKNFVNNFKNSDNSLSLMLTEVPNPKEYGIALIDEQKKVITKLLEKPKNPPTNLSIVGIYGFTKEVFEAIKHIKPSWRNELEVTDTMQWMIENNYKAGFEKVVGWWKDTGDAKSLLAANQLILDSYIKLEEGTKDNLINPNIQGRVRIGKNCKIANNAIIRGPAIIGGNCTMGEKVFIGPYTSIGNNVSIRKGEIENSIIMDNVIINTKERLISSIFGRGSVFETKNRIPHGNKVIIGDNSRIEL